TSTAALKCYLKRQAVPAQAAFGEGIRRELRKMGYRKLSARPRHQAQAEGAIETFKTYGPPRLQAISAIRSDQSTPTYPCVDGP
uniref:winged helix-turn-helix domain-containing protein n=1 Tax=Acidisoma sp. S159 TaxID=1747225 RepID=UPI0015761666